MGLILDKNLITKGRASPTDILITVFDESQRVELQQIASMLRERNYCVEVYPASPKLGKQIEYADKKGIPFVFFKNNDSNEMRLKTLATKEERIFSSVEDFLKAFP
jgi:histidyl-tRNA synthetase